MASINSTPSRATYNQVQQSTVLPQAFLVFCDGWTETIIDNAPLTIYLEEEFVNTDNLESFIQLFTKMEESMLADLASHGKDYSVLNSFRYMLPDYIVSKICDCTTLHLFATGHKGLKNTNEYYKYHAAKMLRN